MARLKFGIFGPISGKLGSVVGATWKGIPYLRGLPEKKELQRSPAQLANEGKFKFVNDWLIPFHPYISIGFQNLAIGKTAIAAALSANYKTVFTGTYPELSVNYAALLISTGSLSPLSNIHIGFIDSSQMEISWNQNYRKGAAYNDQVMLVLYSPVLGLADGFVGAANRAAGHCRFSIDPRLSGQELHAYISMVSLNRTLISNSIYLGKLNPL